MVESAQTLDDQQAARNIARDLLRRMKNRPMKADVEKCVDHAIQTISLSGEVVVDRNKLVWDLETSFNTWCSLGTILENKEDHIDWSPVVKTKKDWDFWKRFEQHELESKPPAVVQSLDEMTDMVLSRLENPERKGIWSRRGMVVGQVQSGKTSNYTALVCKAVDAGYKLIVVLSGLHDSLRVQTQERLDSGFLGTQFHKAFDTANSKRVGVGLIPWEKELFAYSGTNSGPKGDFNRTIAKQYTTLLGGQYAVLLVVKKNKPVLNNLLIWASLHGKKELHDGKKIGGIPLLVIDDEADNASVDTKELPRDDKGKPLPDHDPTAINGQIRKLLTMFEQNAYVGYTATPFANIFIHPEATSNTAGEDLFPRSFIINLPTPSNYIGPSKVFGLRADENVGLEHQEGLDVIRTIDDYGPWMPDKHKKDWNPGEMPQSLAKAIKAFLLVCAARHYRGQEQKHNSMLVHVTRYTDVQELVGGQVRAELDDIRQRLKRGEGKATNTVLDDFRELWTDDFLPTTKLIREQMERAGQPLSDTTSDIDFDELIPYLKNVVGTVEVKKINGAAKDILDYFDPKKVVNVIAIGGDKLSRGLTLEGLSVSYYLRASRMYDTLMQMGRWFGYRPGYVDLCRLYTSSELIENYRDITAASEELRAEFDAMAEAYGTPRNFGLKVRTHSDNLKISSAGKIKNGIPMKVTYAGGISETVVFKQDKASLESNLHLIDNFVFKLTAKYKLSIKSENLVWTDVSADEVLNFLSGYIAGKAKTVRPDLIAKFIEQRVSHGRLTNWTVAFISSTEKDAQQTIIGGQTIGLTLRSVLTPVPLAENAERYSIRRLISGVHEMIDLPPEKVLELNTKAKQEREPGVKTSTPSGPDIRSSRPPQEGLLLLYALKPHFSGRTPAIGFAISFPKDEDAPSHDYKVNNVYWEQEIGEE